MVWTEETDNADDDQPLDCAKTLVEDEANGRDDFIVAPDSAQTYAAICVMTSVAVSLF